jgi:LmbE family N-acetylglucosaminyl deacetylase
VADATNLTGYDGRFDTVIDSGLYHCLDDDGRLSYAAGLHRATRSGARWHLYCFSDGTVNGVLAPRAAVTEQNIRDTLTANGWRIEFLGPTTYLANTSSFGANPNNLPEQLRLQMPQEQLERMQEVAKRVATIVPLVDDDRMHLPFTVVHAVRVD